MNDIDPVSPYLRRRIRSLEEAQKDQLAAGNVRLVIFRALNRARAGGAKPNEQFQQVVDALLACSPDLPEAVAVDAVHKLLEDDLES